MIAPKAISLWTDVYTGIREKRGGGGVGDGEGWSGVEQEHWRVSQLRTNTTRERERVVDLEITVKTLCPRLVIILLHR